MEPKQTEPSVVLRQRLGVFGGSTKYALADNGVEVSRRRRGTRMDSRVPYAVMSPNFIWHRDVPVGWIIGAAAAFGSSALGLAWGIYQMLTLPRFDFGTVAAACFLVALFALPMLYGAVVNWRDWVLVANRYAEGNALVLYARRPSRAAVTDFLQKLQRRIEGALGPEEEGGLAQELRKLAELHRKGVLTDGEFALAKRQLLAD